MEKKIIIAIDGFSSCGKSTLAKAMAKALEYVFVDTGAMYRAIALYFLRNNIAFNDTAANETLHAIKLKFKFNSISQKSDMYLNGENVEADIRNMLIANNVSFVASSKEVREKLVSIQRELGISKGVVMDGRDIGTVVFPDAELKLFVTSDTDIRAKRRYNELRGKGEKVSLEDVKANLEKRDYIDSHRKESPLTQAEDAVIIDTSHLTREEQTDVAYELVMGRVLP